MKPQMVKKVKLVLSLCGNFLVSSTDVLGMYVSDLAETPLGTYQKKALPAEKRPKQRVMLDMPPAKNQGPLGTCASFAVVGCAEYHYDEALSEAEFTILAETRPSGDCKPGINLGQALQIGQQFGFVEEDRLPYNSYLRYVAAENRVPLYAADWQEQLRKRQNPSICKRYATRGRYDPIASYNNTMTRMGVDIELSGTAEDVGDYQLGNLYPIHHVSTKALSTALQTGNAIYEEGGIGGATDASIKRVRLALTNGFPVAVALPVFDTFLNPSIVSEYTIDVPSGAARSVGSHAVVLSGYDTKKQVFRVKNSWGEGWGDEGSANLSFDYVRNFATQLVAVAKR
jgi:hypothetical protein